MDVIHSTPEVGIHAPTQGLLVPTDPFVLCGLPGFEANATNSQEETSDSGATDGHAPGTEDPSQLLLTQEYIESLTHYNFSAEETMDAHFPHSYAIKRDPDASQIQGEAQSTETQLLSDGSLSTPITDPVSSGTSMESWDSTPTGLLSADPFQQQHYKYPQTATQTQQRSQSMAYVSDYRIAQTTSYSTQPRSSAPIMPQLDLHSSQFQFPLNNMHPQQPQPQTQMPVYHPTESSFPFVPTPGSSAQSPYTLQTPYYMPPMQEFPFQGFPSNLPHPSQRSHSYTEVHVMNKMTPQYNKFPNRLFKASPDPGPSGELLHKREEFTPDDIKVLKSLLSNGEKAKWKFISKELSETTGRRATSSTCFKKARELFKIPSEKASGILGSSLPYVVHNSWDRIKENKD